MSFERTLIFFSLCFILLIANSYASDCNLKVCNGLVLPESAHRFIMKGYKDVGIKIFNNNKYIFLSSESDVNKCSVIFNVKDGQVESIPPAGEDGKLCNILEVNGNIVSSYRDQGVWFNDIYQISSEKTWVLLFSDSCADCHQIKRTYYTNGAISRVELMSEGDNYSIRKPLSGVVLVQKAILYSMPDEQKKLKAYLVKGDVFKLSDMSDDGFFYRINYVSSSGKEKVYWIKSDDFVLK